MDIRQEFRDFLRERLSESSLISNAEKGIFKILNTKYKKLGVTSVSISHSSLYEITAYTKDKEAQVDVGNSDIRAYEAIADILANELK